MKNIRYIGKKAERTDNVAGTGIVWNGFDDVQPVQSDAAAAKLLAHPDIWALADEQPEQTHDWPTDDKPEGEAKTDEKPVEKIDDDSALAPMANLETMDKSDLKSFAQRHFNHEFHPNTGEAKMRQTIIGLMNRG